MTQQTVITLIRDVLMVTFWTSAPLLVIGFIAGLIVGLVQIVTSLQDVSVGSIPRLLAFYLGLLALMPWMLLRLVSYTQVLLGDLSKFAR